MGNNMFSRPHSQNMQNSARNVNNSSNKSCNIPPCGNNSSGNGDNSSSESCDELMHAIMEADFFAQDLKLYLDTHPDDTRAIEMFREAIRQSKACKAAFEDSFYPLTASSAGINGKWDWLDGSFPPCT